MDFREFIERDMSLNEGDEDMKINLTKVRELIKKLEATGKSFDGLYEDGVKAMSYLVHLKASNGNKAAAAKTLKVSAPKLQDKKKAVLAMYEIPEDTWKES
jgi:hypothetical protein